MIDLSLWQILSSPFLNMSVGMSRRRRRPEDRPMLRHSKPMTADLPGLTRHRPSSHSFVFWNVAQDRSFRAESNPPPSVNARFDTSLRRSINYLFLEIDPHEELEGHALLDVYGHPYEALEKRAAPLVLMVAWSCSPMARYSFEMSALLANTALSCLYSAR
jgi:hypothetical protein